MSEAEFSIHTPTDDVLTLDQAVLLYHGRSGGALATVHEILTVDGAPVIGAGRAMTAQAARDLAGWKKAHDADVATNLKLMGELSRQNAAVEALKAQAVAARTYSFSLAAMTDPRMSRA